jgi:YihY family inner membrane protein
MSAVVASRLVVHRSPASRCKQLLLGPPLATSRLVRQRLGKLVALAVFSSDAISSTAYGTEQIMLVLLAAGRPRPGWRCRLLWQSGPASHIRTSTCILGGPWRRRPMNPIEAALRRVDRFQQRHPVVGLPFAVVKKFGDDKGGNLITLLAWNSFFALLPLLLVLVTLLGYLLRRNPAMRQQVLHSAFAEFPIIGTQLQGNVHSLHTNGLGLVVGIAGSLWGARGVTQAGQHAMAEIWNIPGKERPSFWTRQVRGLALLLVFALGLVATTLLTGFGSLGNRSAVFRLANLAAAAGLNVGLFLLGFRVLTPRQIPLRRLVAGAVVAGIGWQGLLAAGGYLVGHNLKHATEVYGFFATVLGLLSWLYLGSELTLYAAEVNVVLTRRLWPRSILQPPLTGPDQRALVDLAKQEERRPEQSIEVRFNPQDEQAQEEGSKIPGRER